MRLLFYLDTSVWSGGARAFVAVSQGLATRGHQVTLVCPPDSDVQRRAAARGLDVAPIALETSGTGVSWPLRRLMQDRFIEVAFVHGDRAQLVVSSAMRLAERGAVIRRVPSFEPPTIHGRGRLALKMAAAGLLFSAESESRAAVVPRGFALGARVAPLGVEASAYDAVRPIARASIGLRDDGLLILVSYTPGARIRAIGVLRTLAILTPRHPELHVAVTGAGSEDEDLRMHAAALGVHSLVTYLGETEDPLPLLKAADVGWVVAEHDDGAFACLDYMAMRIPVLADRGPLPQHYVADGIGGVLLAPGDPPYTAAAVSAFLAQADRRTAMGNAGRVRVQREFPEGAMLDAFEAAAEGACDRARWALR